MHDKVEHVELLPVFNIFLIDLNILIVDVAFRDIDLDITARLELKVFAFREFDNKLFDEGSHVTVAHHFAFPFLDTEDLRVDGNLHVFAHFHLAAEAPVVELFFSAEETCLGREDSAAAF